MTVMVRVLGPVELVVGETVHEITRSKERALLAVLAAQRGRPVPVEAIIDDLWAGDAPTNATSGLHVFVSRLRRLLGDEQGGRLHHTAGGYVLELTVDELDSSTFERTVADAQGAWATNPDGAATAIRGALGMWRGRPFEGVDTATTTGEAARLEELRTGALETLFTAELAAGHHASVISELDQVIAAQPFHERFHGMRMLALYRSGRQVDALRRYRELRRLTLDELGFEPTPELQRLELALLEHDPRLEWVAGDLREEPLLGLASTRGDAPTPDRIDVPMQPRLGDVGEAPVVGREAEQKILADVMEPGGPRRLQAAVVTGPAGVGKTSLVFGSARAAGAAGATVVVGRCDENVLGPYQPVAEMVRWILDHVPTTRLLDVLPEATLAQLRRLSHPMESATAPVPHGDVNPVELFEAVAGLLRTVAMGTRLILVLEDLHWIDQPTAEMVRYVVRRLESDPVVVVCTQRPDDTAAASHQVLTALRRGGAVRDLPLAELSAADVSKIAEHLLGRPVEPDVAAAIHEQTAGNPLFVVEFLRQLVERGALGLEARPGDATTVRTAAPPPSILELVEQRIARLDAFTVRVLTTSAVLGREFDIQVVALSLGLETDAVVTALDATLSTGLVTAFAEAPGRYAFSHALIQRALYDRTPVGERASLHRLVADALEVTGIGSASQLAKHHFEAAASGPTDKAFTSGILAAHEAKRALAFDDSLEILGRTLRLAEARGTERDRIDLLLNLGDAHWWAGDVDRSQDMCGEALELARRQGDGELFARAVLGRWRNNGAATQGFSASVPDTDLIDMIEDALAGLTEHPALRAALLGRLGIASYWTVPFDRRQELADSAVALARASGDDAVLLDVLVDRQLTLWAPGAEVQRLERSKEILVLARRLGQTAREADARTFEAVDHLALGDVDAADASIRQYLRLSSSLRQPFYRWHAHYLPALRALMDGRFEEAESLAAGATDQGETDRPGAEGTVMLTGLQTLWLFYERGALGEIAPMLELVAETFGEIPAMDAARAWVAAETGDLARARELLDELAAREFEIAKTDIAWLAAMCLLASAAAAVGDEKATRILRTILEPHTGRNVLVWVGMCIGPVDHYRGRLAASLGELVEAAEAFDAAAALATRMRATPLLLRIRLDRCRLGLRAVEPPYDALREELADIRTKAAALGMVGVVGEADDLLETLPT